PGLLGRPVDEQVARLDARLAAYLADPRNLTVTRELAVVPVLGVPGWHPENAREAFYDDTNYFRPVRLREKRS
ncbi:MAG: DUF3025 domain-containing protein, partial [Burkholderiales bacterium]